MKVLQFDIQKFANISNYTKNKVLNGTAANDTINNYAGGVTIRGGGGKDYIYNSTDKNYTIKSDYGYVTIDGGDGDDTIKSIDPRISINGGAGSDLISLYSYSGYDSITINGGAGNDIIYGNSLGGGTLYQYKSGDGDDIIYGYKATDTITITGSAYTTQTSGNNVIVKISTGGNITLSGAKGKTLNIYPTVSPVINNYTKNTTVRGTSSADTIRNYAGGVKIQGGGGKDSIYSSTDKNYTINSGYGYVTIDGGDGDDTIKSIDPRTSINGGAGSDLISLYSYSGYDSITINGGAGNDIIYGNSLGGGTLYQYKSGDGRDTIYGFKSKDTLSITGTSYVTIQSGNDLIYNMNGGSITLKNYKPVPVITPLNVSNYTKNKVLDGTAANDTINNYAGGVKIIGNGGNDSIYNSTDSSYTINGAYGYVTIDGGDGDDTIKSYDPRVSISGGAGADLISLYGSCSYITINGGKGDDIIYGGGTAGDVLYQYKSGDGNDIIYNFNANDTLSISGGTYTTTTSGNDILVNVANSGTITLSGAKGKTLNIYPTVSPVINNYTKNTSISGKTTADTINNYAGGVTIRGNSGNDSIFNSTDSSYTINSGYGYVTIDGGDGNDTIKTYDPRISISGGAGSDLISLRPWSGTSKVTVNAGTGSDTIYGDSLGGGTLYQYKSGDGNDIIYGYKSTDSITITGSAYTTQTSGNNVIVKMSTGGNITLSGAKGMTLNISSNVSTPTPTPTPTSAITGQEVIKKFMKSLDDTNTGDITALSTAVNTATNGHFKNIYAAMNQMVADCQYYNNTYGSNGWNKFLLEKCGINLDNDDTGAITGYDAGDSTYQKTPSSIIFEGTSVPNFYTDNKFKINNVNVKLCKENAYGYIVDENYNNLNNTQKYIWQGLYTWWAKGALDIVANSYGSNYSFTSSVNTLYFGFFSEAKDADGVTLNYTTPITNNGTRIGMGIFVNIHPDAYGSLENVNNSGGNPDGRIKNWSTYLLDRVLAHEMTHATMWLNIDNFKNLPQFIAEGTAELVHGIDDDRRDLIISLAKNSTYLKNNLDLYDHGTGNTPMYAAGYMFLRYLAKQGAENYYSYSTAYSSGTSAANVMKSNATSSTTSSNVKNGIFIVSKDYNEDIVDLTEYASTVKGADASATSKNMTILGRKNADSITAGSGNDTVFAGSSNDTVIGGDGTDKLYGEGGNDCILGGTGNDTLAGGTGTDTLTGGAGNDIFMFIADNDIITDYEVGKDKIRLAAREMEITNSTVSGSDVILQVGGYGTISVKGGKGKKITVVDEFGNETSKVYSGTSTSTPTPTVTAATLPSGWKYGNTAKTNLTASISSAANIDLTQTYGTSVATVDGSKVTRALTITGNSKANSMKGGSGADTISGGTGNDTVSLGGGKDVYIYSGGNDLIQDYTAGQDKIKLSGTSITSSTLSGSNVILKTAKGNITIQNGKGKKITVIDTSNKETTQIYTGTTSTATLPSGWKYGNTAKTNLTASIASAANINLTQTYGTSVATVDGSKVTRALTITGNSKANSMKGGSGADIIKGESGRDTISGGAGNDQLYGGADNDKLLGEAGNDSLYAGTGNDTLTGGAGSDVFIYEGGNDLITDYTAGQDKIKLSGTSITSSTLSGSNVIFKTAKGNITVQSGKGKKITVIDSSNKTTVYSKTLDLFEDNNFVSDVPQISDISKVTSNNYSVGKIETYNYNSLDNLQIAASSQVSLNNK